MTAIDSTSLLKLLLHILSRLPPVTRGSTASASPTVVLILDRISALLFTLSSTLPLAVPDHVAQLFYSTAVSLGFLKYEAGVKETEQDAKNWKKAIAFGLQAGVEDLGKEVMKLQQ